MNVRTAPLEPFLEMDDIQGMAVPGFLKPYHTLLGLRTTNDDAGARKLRELVGEITREVASGLDTFRDREAFRQARLALKTRYPRSRRALTKGDEGAVLVGIGLSYRGLSLLTPGADAIRSEAFRAGMVARSAALGDPQDLNDDGNPANWVVGAPGKELDALIVVAGDHREPVSKRSDVLRRRIEDCGIHVVYREDGNVRQTPMEERGHEHFGFDDGVSQPAIRGRVRIDGDEKFISQRNVDPRVQPETWLYGRPGQTLVWPGELVLGQPASSPDPLLPGPPSVTTPPWTRNGSFLVFRRLRQDVGLFWRTMRDTAAALSKSGWKITDLELAARLVGRWPSGAPVNRISSGDDRALGTTALANNYFKFDSDTVKIALVADDGMPYDDPFPQAKADPLGLACPWAAHIRKVNVRDSGSDMGGGDATYRRRLLRIGIPFGTFLDGKQKYQDHSREKNDRGLLFLSIQASIEDQFEFLQTSWMNDDARPKMPGGNDMIVGQNAAAVGGVRRCTLIGPKLQAHDVSAPRQWVVPTGGGYFFVPSLSALREVLAR
ncbi:MAG TPA: Dyp-type peroxidase [Candidatus Elarobacter sp.]|nr:Dyp-type peroxidase [Candidatus Elarobacter sp.]